MELKERGTANCTVVIADEEIAFRLLLNLNFRSREQPLPVSIPEPGCLRGTSFSIEHDETRPIRGDLEIYDIPANDRRSSSRKIGHLMVMLPSSWARLFEIMGRVFKTPFLTGTQGSQIE
jgi:hypothetical protein